MAAVMGCVSLSYGQEAVEASYDDFGKPTATSGPKENKRYQTSGEVLNGVGLLAESPLTFTPTGTNVNQAWANSDNPILANPGATFDLKVTYADAWGSLTVFQLRSDVEPSAADKIFGTYQGSWYSGVSGTGELYTNINNDTQSGITATTEGNMLIVTCPITIPSDLSVGEMVVIRFIVCKTADGATYDGDPCSTTAVELNYCDYVVKIVPEKQYGAVTLGEIPAEQGSAEIQSYDEATSSWVSASDLSRVEFGTELRVAVTPAEGYAVGDVTMNETALTANEDGYYYFTVNEENVAIAVSFQVASSIDRVESQNVYYNAGEAVLYTADAQRVEIFDLSGRVVMRAADVASVDVSTLNGGVYIAVVDGKVVKFVK